MRRRYFLTLAAAPLCAEPDFSRELWSAIDGIYSKTLSHPFLQGLRDGSLPRRKFQYYLLQDALYLDAYSKGLSLLAGKAPKQEWAIGFYKDAIESLEVEAQMHNQILASYGITARQRSETEMAPVNYAYTNHLMAACGRAPFPEALAAMLPCYWIYWEVGKRLVKSGSRNPDYQRWIQQYAGDAYAKTVQRVLQIMNASAKECTAAQRASARRLFILSARYEYLFWDMAWREEQWQPV